MKEKKVKITHRGELDIAGFKQPCFVLEDGKRVLSLMGVQLALKMVDEDDKRKSGSRLGRYLSKKMLQPLVNTDKNYGQLQPIIGYRGEQKINCFEATVLVDVANIFLEARKRGMLTTDREEIIAEQSEIIVRSFAKVGIIALIDEATGYQYERERFELRKILKTHVLEGKLFLRWKETFPLSFYKELFGVYNVPFTAENIKRKPRFIGWLTNELVYKNLPKGEEILKKIKERTPKTKGGNPKKRQHQSLTKKVGREALIDVIATVRTLARISKGDRNKFRRLVKEMYRLDQELPYIDAEAMDDNKKETKFDKAIKVLIKNPPQKKTKKKK